MKRFAVSALTLGLLLVATLVALPLAVLFGSSPSSAGCATPPGAPVTAGPTLPEVPGWDAEQVTNAAAIVGAGAEAGVPLRGQVIGVMTAIGESGLRVLDYGDTAGPDSRGLFQQRDNGAWGTLADRMGPRSSALSFFRVLLTVPGWETLPPTTVAHTVQRNADPYYYEPFYERAVALVATITGADGADIDVLAAGGTSSCDQVLLGDAGVVVLPIPPSYAETNRNNWGASGGNWSSWHTGTDFSVPCGTPVIAATAGTIEIDTASSWAGRWLVKVATGPGQLSTWYAHMQALNVSVGQVVSAGQVLGEVGAEGNATGCHLHFEVHTAGGSIYGPDNVDPTIWLAANLGKATTAPGAAAPAGGRTVVSFNALGDSHTAPGGNKPGFPSGADRTRSLVAMMNQTKPDLIGLQEFQGPQLAVFNQLIGAEWDTFGDQDNVVAWRRSAFELVAKRTISIPYFGGNARAMPVVTLRDVATGKLTTVIDVHNPADVRGPAGGFRAEAIRRERDLVAQEQAAGRATLLLGDFNDREEAFCAVTAGGLLAAANGGTSSATGCTPLPAPVAVDWIFGSGVTFGAYVFDNTPQTSNYSDHPWVSAVTAPN